MLFFTYRSALLHLQKRSSSLVQWVQVDSPAGSITASLQARVGQNPEHAQLLSEHRRMEKGRKELENQVPKTLPLPRPLLTHPLCPHAHPNPFVALWKASSKAHLLLHSILGTHSPFVACTTSPSLPTLPDLTPPHATAAHAQPALTVCLGLTQQAAPPDSNAQATNYLTPRTYASP